MIPHKIQLKNFLSYGPELQTIDFSCHNLICFSGKNGHGKSALLDAITWAVWGQARKVSGNAKADEGLVHIGQTQMLVIFDFSFNNSMYRIRREYMKTYGKHVASLEFGILESTTGRLTPLTDKTIRATQKKIENTLRLDFDAFSNSAFLRQGNANEFSKKSSKDRKKILASILGLDQYEVLKKLAMEHAKKAHQEKNILEHVQEQYLQELNALPELQTQLATTQKTLQELAKTLHKHEKEKEKCAQKKSFCIEQQKESDIIGFQIKRYTQEQEAYNTRIRSLVHTWRLLNAKGKHLLNSIPLEKDKQECIAMITHHQKLLQTNLENKERLLHIQECMQKIIHDQQNNDTTNLREHQRKQEHIRASCTQKIDMIQHVSKLHKEQKKEYDALVFTKNELKKKIESHPLDVKKIEHNEQQFEKRKAAYQQFTTLGNLLKKELMNLHTKDTLSHDDNDPSCPLCEQNLSASRRRFLKTKFAQQKYFLQHRFNRLNTIIPKLKAILIEQHKSVTLNKKKQEQYYFDQSRLQELAITEKKMKKTDDSIRQQIAIHTQELEQLKKEAHKIDAFIHTTDTYRNNKEYIKRAAEKKTIEKQLSDHVYDHNAHKKTEARLHTIEKQLNEYETVRAQLNTQKERKEEISSLCKALKQIKLQLTTLTIQLDSYKNLPTTIELLHKQEQEIVKQYKTLVTEKELLLQQQARLQTKKEKVELIALAHKEQRAKIAVLNTTIHDYQTIATATGKDGIQALLIEEAIPEIEHEANNLLSKLTNNQSHIIIDSLRDLKKGGTKETLDIKISDSVGIRPYELFSGGEAFRIDFALRIAISKLLARRAGTALQTLIIDEGFGSQDEEGLNHIMDAIHKIQDDFAKIIIVSHLHSMQDQFPIHFVIHKGPQGSFVNVLEQG